MFRRGGGSSGDVFDRAANRSVRKLINFNRATVVVPDTWCISCFTTMPASVGGIAKVSDSRVPELATTGERDLVPNVFMDASNHIRTKDCACRTAAVGCCRSAI